MKQGDCNQEIVIKDQLKYKGKYLEIRNVVKKILCLNTCTTIKEGPLY